MRSAALVIALLLVSHPARADGPCVVRVDPPSWWSPANASEITLLVEGSGLKGARVSTDNPGIEVVRAECPNEGSSLFVDLKLGRDVAPGPVVLEFEAGGEKFRRAWTVLDRSSHTPNPLGLDDVIYLVMPDRFANGDAANDLDEHGDAMLDRANPHAYHGGDFAGLKARLPYLADLGVTALWLTPVYRAAPSWFHTRVHDKPRKFADFHGYSPVDFYDTNTRFGTRAEYRALVDEAHKLGLKVIQDQIVGTTGPQHRWVKNPPAPGWFHGPMDKPPACNFRFDALVNPHAREADRLGLTDGWFFGILPDLDTKNARVKTYMIQQSLWWTELFAADAIRLDAYPMVDRAFWRDWSKAQKSLHPEMLAIGEAWIIDAADLSFFQGGREGWDGVDPGIGTLFDFPLNLAIMDVTSNKASASKLAKTLSRDFLYPSPERLVTFLDNHDTPRLASSPNVTPARYRLAAAFLLTSRGIPQLSWGDEIGLGGHGDDRRTIPGGWPGDVRSGFARPGRTDEEQATFEAFQTLLKLRKDHPALRRGTTTELIATDAVYVVLRQHEGERLLIALNFGDKPASVPLPNDAIHSRDELDRIYGEGQVRRDAGCLIIEVPAERTLVFRVR